MNSLPTSYLYFLRALEFVKSKEGTGFQNRLSLKIGRSEGYISQLFSKKSIAAFGLQNEIANACGYEYEDFLILGKKISLGNQISLDKKENNIMPMDPAIQILQEALEETGVKINDKQKEAVIKILREELKESGIKTKDGIMKYLEAFGK